MKRLVVATLLLVGFGLCAMVPAWGFYGANVEEIKRLAEEGNPDAQAKLGVLYSTGFEVPQDKKAAAQWYRKSADQGSALGKYNLAFMYIRGEGVEENYVQARKLLTEAADLGFSRAAYDLGVMCMQGLGGERDMGRARELFVQADQQGSREAKEMLEKLDSLKLEP